MDIPDTKSDFANVGNVVSTVFSDSYERLIAFGEMLEQEGEKRGLIGPREVGRMWSRHILNCTAINGFIEEGSSVADVGSGAGFPGVVLALTRPDLDITLIEPMERRTVWLDDVACQLDIRNVRVLRARAQEIAVDQGFDVVTARAVAGLEKLLTMSCPLVRHGGQFIFLKGRKAGEEIEASRPRANKLGVRNLRAVEVPSLTGGEPTTVVVGSKS